MGTILATATLKCMSQSTGVFLFLIFPFKAAKFGRGYLDLYNPTDFVNMGQTLKVLNAVRFYEIGLPLTYAQYVAPMSILCRFQFHYG